MNVSAEIVRKSSVCPHDCPSVCALDVEVIGGARIGRIRGAPEQTYTSGVVCAKVARYAERIHHPDRLTEPLMRVGPKGSGQFAPIGWDEALDRVAEAFLAAERTFGSESVWPYFYAGTMGQVMRDGIERLTHAKRYSRFYGTICVGIAWPGYVAGTGKLIGADPREMAKSDCVVIWGTNAVATQVNVMTHAIRARKERGAKIVAIDIYETETMRQADLALRLRPGTRRRARLRRHARPVPRRPRRPRLSRALHRRPCRTRGASPDAKPGVGGCDHRPGGRRDRGLCGAGRQDQADLFPPRLWLLAAAQRRGQPACRALDPGRDGGLGVRGRRRVPQQQRRLQAEEDHDRGTGRPRFARSPPRPVPRRRHPHRRCRRR